MKTGTFRGTLVVGILAQSVLSGCFPALENRRSVETAFTAVEMPSAADGSREASVGQYMAMGNMQVKQGPAWKLKEPLKTKVPGTFGVNFDVEIQPCVLEAWYQCDDGVAFVAPSRFAKAIYDGKSVFSDQDELGLRVGADGKTAKLYCDNGVFNMMQPGYCIWSRPATAEELRKFEKIQTKRIFPYGDARAIVFSGVSKGKLTLTLEEWVPMRQLAVRQSSKDYTFDLAPNGVTRVAVQGCVIDVLSVSSAGIRFRVDQPFPEAHE